MTDLISVATVNGIEIEMDPQDQRYRASVNGVIVTLKSLSELKKRCRSAFEKTTVLHVQGEPRPYGSGLRDTAIQEVTIIGVTEHQQGSRRVYELVTPSYSPGGRPGSQRLTADLFVVDHGLMAELQAIENDLKAYVASAGERWRKTLADRGRQLTIENLLQGKPAPSTDGDTP